MNELMSFCTGAGVCLLETCPCLLHFISSVVNNTALDPAVISFTLKLTGLLAASEDGFKLLQVDCTHPSQPMENATLCGEDFAVLYDVVIIFQCFPPPTLGMFCSRSGLQSSPLAGKRTLGGPLFKDRLDPGLEKLTAPPGSSRFLCKIR